MADSEIIGKSLELLDENIKTLLADKSLTTDELIRGLLRSQRAMLPFFSQVSVNTEKIAIMYPFYKSSAWLLGVIVIANVGVIVGLVTHTINLP
jgi:hypothetical protein